MHLIVGLGNPGPEYAATRHNLGFRVVEGWLKRFGCRREQMRWQALLFESPWEGGTVLLAKPLTYMNRSGEAVAPLVRSLRLDLERVWVVCDDFSLPLGRLRLRRRGSDGGHRGLRSVIQALGSQDFPRLRMGVGPVPWGMDPIEFVLSPFTPEEQPAVETMCQRAVEALACALQEGIEAAMNRYNAPAE